MNIMHTMASETRTTQVPKRRFYSPELKLQVVQICVRPGASIAGIALQHGINTNIVHRWIREHSQGTLVTQPQAFVPLTLSTQPEPVASQPVTVAATPEIRMELRRGTSPVTVMWPSELAGDCGAWLRELIRIDALWLATTPIDMRMGAERLLAQVVQVFGAAQAHHGYLFANSRGNRMKLLLHDGFGMWCAARRLNQGGFEWPRGGVDMASSITLTKQQFDALVLGLPWSRLEQMQSITRV